MKQLFNTERLISKQSSAIFIDKVNYKKWKKMSKARPD